MRLILAMILTAILALPLACSDKKPDAAKSETTTQLQAPDSTGVRPANFVWEVKKHRMINFYYEPDDTLNFYATDLLKKTLEIYEFCCQYLLWETPEPIEFYCYKDVATLNLYTSRSETFFVGNKIYYGYGPAYGRPFAELVMSKLPGGKSKFAFMQEGLPLLLDYTGRNYHHTAYQFVSEGKIHSVAILTSNEEYLKENAGMRQIEAASLIAYMTWEWGSQKFMQIYHSDMFFETALKYATGADLAQLESQWYAYLPEHTADKDAEREAAARQGSGQ
jgi:hypothetical protein